MAYRALEQPRIGWIGAGRMGLQMAARLLDAGHDVAIYNRTAAKAAPMVSRGAGRKRDTDFLAAPVSGNPKVVSAGKLSLAVSGPQDTFAAAEPLLALFGARVTYVGDDEVARLVKICHNVLLGVVIQALSEVTVLAEKGGTSRAAFLEFVNHSVLGSMFTRYTSPALVNLDFTPTFTNPLLLKDFDLGLAAARD